jgi:hypothetical protein
VWASLGGKGKVGISRVCRLEAVEPVLSIAPMNGGRADDEEKKTISEEEMMREHPQVIALVLLLIFR